MNKQWGAMEEEILKEENPKEEKPKDPILKPNIKIHQVKFSLKNLKIIPIIVILASILLLIVGLNLKSKTAKETQTAKIIETVQEEAPNPSPNPEIEKIAKRLQVFGQNINQIGDSQTSVSKPIVDLAISF